MESGCHHVQKLDSSAGIPMLAYGASGIEGYKLKHSLSHERAFQRGCGCLLCVQLRSIPVQL